MASSGQGNKIGPGRWGVYAQRAGLNTLTPSNFHGDPDATDVNVWLDWFFGPPAPLPPQPEIPVLRVGMAIALMMAGAVAPLLPPAPQTVPPLSWQAQGTFHRLPPVARHLEGGATAPPAFATLPAPVLSWRPQGALHAPLRTNYHLYGSETFAPIPPPLVENLSWQQRGALHAPLRTNYHQTGETFAPPAFATLPAPVLSWLPQGALHAPLRKNYHQAGETFAPVTIVAPLGNELSWQQRGALHAPLRTNYHQTGEETFSPLLPPAITDLSWQPRGAVHAPLRTNYHQTGEETFSPLLPPAITDLSWQPRGSVHAPLRTNYHQSGEEAFSPLLPPSITDLSWQPRGAVHAPLRTNYHQTGETFSPPAFATLPAPVLSWRPQGALHAPLRTNYHLYGSETFAPINPIPNPVVVPPLSWLPQGALHAPLRTNYHQTGEDFDPPVAYFRLFVPTDVPASTSAAGVSTEVGVRFTQSVNGYINGIKFYRHNTNSGPHNCHLWTIGGALLASAQITTPAGPSGWFQATFATPIAVNGGTTYVASTHTTDFYGFTNTFFPFANSPLSASSATAGVRKAGANPTFPDATADATNYWVDVEYEKAADVSVPDLSWQQRGALHAPLRTNYHLYGSETFAPIPPPLVENLSWQQRGALHAPLRTNYHLYGSETFAPINLPPIVDLSWQQRGALHAPLRTSYHQTGEAFEPVRLPDPAPIISDLSWQQRGALHAPLRIAYHQTGEVFEPVREPDPDPPPVAEPHADYDTQPMGGGSNTGYIASATSGNLDKFLDEHELLQKQVTNAWDGVSGTLEDAWERPEELGETPTDEELTAPPENPVVTWDELPEGAELDELLVDTDGAVEEAYPADPEAPEPEQHLSVPEDAEKPGRLATLASLLPPPSSGAAVSGYSAMAGYAAAKAGKLLLEKAEPTSDWAKKHGNVVAAAAATGAALVLSTKINFLKERRGAIALGGAIAVLELAGESFAAEQQAAQPLADAITPPDPGPDPTQDELDAVWQGVETEDALGDDQPVQPRPASNKARYVEKQKKKRGLAALGDLLPPPTSGASGSGGASVAGYATAKAGKMLMEKVEPTSDWGKKHGKVVAAAAATGAALLLSTKVGFLKKNRGEIALGGILAVLELASEAYGAKKTEEPDIPDNTTPLLLVGDEEE